jgi:acetylornithine deacetylase
MENRIIAILSELVRIDSVSPTLSDGPGEIEIAKFVRQYLHQLKLDVEIQTVAPNRVNVVAVIQGTSHKRSLLLNSHLDTVGVEDFREALMRKRLVQIE